MKIIGVGLSKTGTTSLAGALQILGFSCIHSCESYMLETASAMVDGPAAARFPQLDVLYPGSKFILTVRDKQEWLQSCAAHWQRTPMHSMHPYAKFEFGWCRVKLFGTTDFEWDN